MEHYNFQPQLRPAPANLLTRAGWLRGTFRVPPHQSLLDFLVGSVNVVKLTKASAEGEPSEYSFIGLRREAIALIEPTMPDELIVSPGAGHITSPRAVCCIFDAGTLTGTLDALVNVRVSDFLRAAPDFMIVRDALFVPNGESAGGPGTRRMRIAVVNVPQLVGVAEREGHGNA